MPTNLYDSIVSVDQKTGLPDDYASLIVAYEPLVRKAAYKAGIPAQDIDDAVQEVVGKFFAKGGLDFYDPERNTKFATLYYSWCSMFMLQERDKYQGAVRKYLPVEEFTYDQGEDDFSPEIDAETAVQQWVLDAGKVLANAGRADLIDVLQVCHEYAKINKKFTYALLAQELNVSPRRAGKMVIDMRKILSAHNMGVPSLENL